MVWEVPFATSYLHIYYLRRWKNEPKNKDQSASTILPSRVLRDGINDPAHSGGDSETGSLIPNDGIIDPEPIIPMFRRGFLKFLRKETVAFSPSYYVMTSAHQRIPLLMRTTDSGLPRHELKLWLWRIHSDESGNKSLEWPQPFEFISHGSLKHRVAPEPYPFLRNGKLTPSNCPLSQPCHLPAIRSPVQPVFTNSAQILNRRESSLQLTTEMTKTVEIPTMGPTAWSSSIPRPTMDWRKLRRPVSIEMSKGPTRYAMWSILNRGVPMFS